MTKRGFTLIELMIVVAIIATVAAIAIPNLLRSRMAANEVAAAASCKVYAEAQAVYRRTDWDKDGVLEYAQTIGGPESLFLSNGFEIAVVERALAEAEGPPGIRPKAGYWFMIQLGQTAAAGTARSYIANGNMTAGYAMSGIPDSYDGTGRNTFTISFEGVIYQTDRDPPVHDPLFDPVQPLWAVTE